MARLILPYGLSEKVGHNLMIEARDVGALIKEVRRRFGAAFDEAVANATILVDGVDIVRLKGMHTPLSGSSYVAFLNVSATHLPGDDTKET